MKISAFLLIACISSSHASTLSEWFSKPEQTRGEIPKDALAVELKTAEEIKTAQQRVWDACRDGCIQRGWDKAIPAKPGGVKDWIDDKQIQPNIAEFGDKKMPYIVVAKGEKPAGGWPVFFCLHGGGGNDKATGPHSWEVNTGEWHAQMRLTETVWSSPGLYIIPRMADDREGRWYFSWNQEFIDQLTQQAILFNDANPDRIYLQGISEGGYAAFRLASLMADRFAGSCAMAAAEPIDNAPVENLQHLAFWCSIGEMDTMFDRIGLARTYFKKLEEMKKASPSDFSFTFDEQKGRGHGVDYQLGPAWIAKHTRKAVPQQFHWTVITQHEIHRNRLYWLALDKSPESLPLKLNAKADKTQNLITITATDKDGKAVNDQALRIYLSDELVDLSKEINVMINGNQAFKGIVKPSMEALIRSTAERGDPRQVFPAQVKIKQ